eukprot:737977_1
MDDWHTQNKAFWSLKLKSILHIEFDRESDYQHTDGNDYFSDSEPFCELNRWRQSRHRRIFEEYNRIKTNTKKMLTEKLNASDSIKQKLSHLVSFIPIFEKFAKSVTSVRILGGPLVHFYGYQMDEFIMLLNDNQLTQDEDERKFIFEQINKVVPMYYDVDDDYDEYELLFNDNEYNPEYIQSHTAGYLVSRFDVESPTELLNKWNDFILLNDAYLMKQFFTADLFNLECFLGSTQE